MEAPGCSWFMLIVPLQSRVDVTREAAPGPADRNEPGSGTGFCRVGSALRTILQNLWLLSGLARAASAGEPVRKACGWNPEKSQGPARRLAWPVGTRRPETTGRGLRNFRPASGTVFKGGLVKVHLRPEHGTPAEVRPVPLSDLRAPSSTAEKREVRLMPVADLARLRANKLPLRASRPVTQFNLGILLSLIKIKE
jgi:hypothetical protein